MNLKWGLGIYDGHFLYILYLELLCDFPLPINRIWNCYVISYLANTVELHENKMIAFKKEEDYILISILFVSMKSNHSFMYKIPMPGLEL